MPVKKSEEKKTVKKVTEKTTEAVKKPVGLSVPLYTLDGKEDGVFELPKEIFGGKINKPLLAQALRVYLNNLKSHFSNTKTRGEVEGSTRKVRTQKGTGGARHGSIKAPIYVGGGIALGPKFRKTLLDLPKKMKKAALISALSQKARDKEIIALDLKSISGKTSQMKELFNKLNTKNALVLTDGKDEKIAQSIRNLPGIDILTSEQLNTLNVIAHKTLLLTKEAVEKLEARIKKQELNKGEAK